MRTTTQNGYTATVEGTWHASASGQLGAVTDIRANIGKGHYIAIIRIALFFVVLTIALVATDALVDEGLRRIDTSAFGVFNRITKGQINADVIVSGSSRALNHFDPRIIQKRTGHSAFNIGINGSQTDMQVAVFRTYLEHNQPPALLVQNLDSFTFVTSRSGLWFPAQYIPYLDEPVLYDALETIDPDLWKMRALPLYGYAVHDMNFTWWLGLRGLVGWNPPEDRYLGFQPRDARWSGEFAQFRQNSSAGVAFEIDPRGEKDLEELMDLCRARRIPVLLVYSPVYYEMQAIETNRAVLFERFRAIADRHGAQLWDYSGSRLSYRRDYFVNSQHMNVQGATLFSRQFADDLAGSALVPH
jgi:hypothetical protein